MPEEKQHLISSHNQVIPECASELFEKLIKGSLFEYITQKIFELSENITLTASYNEPSKKYSIKNIAGYEKITERIIKVLGKPIDGIEFMITEDIIDQILSQNIFKVEYSLYELLNPQISQAECLALEKILNFKEIYGIGFIYNSTIFGITLIFVSANQNFKKQELISGFGKLVSHALFIDYEKNKLVQEKYKQSKIIEATSDLLYFKDINGINLFANKAYANFLGKKTADIIGKTDWEILPKNLAQACFDSDQKVLKSNHEENTFEYCELPTGKRLCFHSTKRPVFNENNELIGIVGVSRDITKLINLENINKDKEKNFLDFINAIPDVYYETDENYNITLLNNASFDVLNLYENRPNIIVNLADFIPKDEKDSFIEFLDQAINSKKSLIKEFGFKKQNKYLIPVVINASTIIENNEIKGVRGIIKEITDKKINEQLLSDFEERFNDFIDIAREMMFSTDEDGYFTFGNKFMISSLGYTRKELIGMHISDIVCEPAKNEFNNKISFTKSSNKKQVAIETIWCNKNKQLIPGELTLFASYNDKNEYIGYRGIFYDKTEIKKSKQELQKLIQAVEQSPVAILITNKKGIIEYINPKFTEITGYTYKEIIGQKTTFFQADKQLNENTINILRTIISGKVWQGEFLNMKKHGELFWLYSSISGVRNEEGKITHFISVNEDVTQRKLTEQELIKAKELSEQSNKVKTAFLSNLSHEIRTPMNAIIGFSELIKLQGEKNKKKNDYINQITENGKVLLKLIEDIIDVARIESGDIEINKDEFDYNQLLEDLFLLFEEQIKKTGKPIKLSFDFEIKDKPFIVFSDPLRCRQILTNLLNNAVKFTKTGSIMFGYKIIDEYNFLTYVKDTGIGLTKDQQNIIFDLFRQADGTETREFGGTGIGLTISKNLIELLGGYIWVESESGKGTTFNLNIPYKIPLTKIEEFITDEQQHYDWKNKTVLIAEDNESNFLFLQELLDETNIRIIWAKDGKEAIDVFKSEKNIDIVLMDIQMPGLNGYDVAHFIKKQNPKIPIIAQTAYALYDEKERSLAEGCDDYISKPINIKKLSGILAKFLN